MNLIKSEKKQKGIKMIMGQSKSRLGQFTNKIQGLAADDQHCEGCLQVDLRVD